MPVPPTPTAGPPFQPPSDRKLMVQGQPEQDVACDSTFGYGTDSLSGVGMHTMDPDKTSTLKQEFSFLNDPHVLVAKSNLTISLEPSR